MPSWRSERNQHTWPLLQKQFGNLEIQQYIVRSEDLQSLWKKYIGLTHLLRNEVYESRLEHVIILTIEEWKKSCFVTSTAKPQKGHNFLGLSHPWDAHPGYPATMMRKPSSHMKKPCSSYSFSQFSLPSQPPASAARYVSDEAKWSRD